MNRTGFFFQLTLLPILANKAVVVLERFEGRKSTGLRNQTNYLFTCCTVYKVQSNRLRDNHNIFENIFNLLHSMKLTHADSFARLFPYTSNKYFKIFHYQNCTLPAIIKNCLHTTLKVRTANNV
jgi:hypothetical protein